VLPLVASDVNHRVPAGDSTPPLIDRWGKLRGERPVYTQHRSLPCQQGHAALYFYAQQRNTKQHVSTVKQQTAHS
ncbi:unnamed protein product, partial [Staurois parvus]